MSKQFTLMLTLTLTLALAIIMATYAFGGSAAVLAQADPAHHSYTDSEIARMVQHDLEGLGLGEVQVEVVAGEVTLRGLAPSLGATQKAVKRAEKIEDVQRVSNEMTVEATSDDEIRAGLENKLGRYVHYTIYDHVVSSVHDGRVELSGEVTMPFKVKEIESTLAEVAGVQKIDNQIRVLRDSPADESLRIAVAVGIYRLLPEYAVRPAPPIHVVVENGRVTLYGTVADKDEEKMVTRQARQTPGALDVEDRLQVLP